MSVLIINGSPNENGNTSKALNVVEEGLHKSGIDTKWIHIEKKAVHGCIDCGHCKTAKRCVFEDDLCNTLIDAILEADGIIVGSPVYFSSANSALCALLDRVFYSTCTWHQMFAGKPAAAVVTRYRSGGSAALERLHKYFLCSQMPVVSSNDFMAFKEISHEELSQYDRNILETLGVNMAKLLKTKVEA